MAEEKITRAEVLKLGRLAALEIREDEVATVTGKLDSILGYVSRLQQADVEGVEPLSHVHGSTSVMRDDVTEPSMPVDEILKIAPQSSGRFIKVPIVIEHDS